MAALISIAAFLLSDDNDFGSIQFRKTANHCGIISKTAVSVYFDEIGKNIRKKVHRIRPLGMTCRKNSIEGGLLVNFIHK